MESYDVILIGAGHNGLVCAAYLLKAGYRVLLLEQRSVPGGAATTEAVIPDLAPDFKFNLCAIDHEFIFLGPVIEELELKRHGLEYLFFDPTVFCPHPSGQYFLSYRSLEKTHAAIAQFCPRDADRYLQFIDYWAQLMNAIGPWFNAPPQDLLRIARNYNSSALASVWKAIGSKKKLLDFIRTMITSPEDVLNEWFESEFVKAPLARLAAEIGAPPSQKGITSGMMMMAMRHSPGVARPRGGTGALTEALVKCVVSLGGVILTEQKVKQILIEEGQAIGVRVDSGQILIADSVRHVEQAHALTILGQIPDENPSMYLDVPTILDPSMAPQGKHTLWIEFFAPYQIAGAEGTGLNGTGWTEELKNRVADRVLDKLADYAPNLKSSIIARRVESPAELANRLGSYKGNYYHLDMTLDQMIFLRPLPEIANYKTPIKNLYLTGAGTHPGGSISGMPGRNCAQVFLRDQSTFLQRLFN